MLFLGSESHNCLILLINAPSSKGFIKKYDAPESSACVTMSSLPAADTIIKYGTLPLLSSLTASITPSPSTIGMTRSRSTTSGSYSLINSIVSLPLDAVASISKSFWSAIPSTNISLTNVLSSATIILMFFFILHVPLNILLL